MQAALLLAVRPLCKQYGFAHPTREAILTATGATKSRAYELRDALLATLPSILRPPGRPAKPAQHQHQHPRQADDIREAVLRYVLAHPGCVHVSEARTVYTEAYRHFIVTLRAQHPEATTDEFARAVMIPLGTLKSWLTRPPSAPPETDPKLQPPPEPLSSAPGDTASTAWTAHIETVIAAWSRWCGSFQDFVEHVRHHLRVPMGKKLIARILFANGLRTPRRRPGRSPDELALRGAFETFFPGAQWVGDGKVVHVALDGQDFAFNLELNVDAHSGAFVGLTVSDEEDSDAVIECFDHGHATTGQAPLAQLLDNKPANHTPQVSAALDAAGTLGIRATKERPQNKAHVEGAFGLFAQRVPPIELDTRQLTPRSIARALLLLVATAWAAATNARPRSDRNGRSRVELYHAEQPTDQQIEDARRALQERARRQEKRRETLEARQRPEVRRLLDDHFARLGLSDPNASQSAAIARYPLDAVAGGIAIFTAKARAGSLPQGADGRYLLGIVRNVQAQREGECLTETLLAIRMQANDLALTTLKAQRREVIHPAANDMEVISRCVRRALGSERKIDRLFWLRALADVIGDASVDRPASSPRNREALFQTAAQHINTTFSVPPRERQDALRFLAERVVPLN